MHSSIKDILTDFQYQNNDISESNLITTMQAHSYADRFILNHSKLPSLLSPGPYELEASDSNKYDKFLYREMIQPQNPNSIEDKINSLLYEKGSGSQSVIDYQRVINPQAEKILDAPDIKNDFYLNLLDWSSKGVLAIGLGERVYLYSPEKISELCVQSEQNYICSLSYHPQGSQLSVGLFDGKTQIYDVETETLIRTIKGHSHRVSSSSFTYGLLYTGSRDTNIIGHDVRAHHNVVMKLQGHRGEVCGLKNDACGLASGSNDNLAIIWDINMGRPRYNLAGHKGAVKALTWCPWQRNLLVTGGGASDKTLRLWNIETGKTVNTVNTVSQVCSLVAHPTEPEIISSHGFLKNQLNIWRVGKQIDYLNCNKVAELKGHTKRVLHMAMSPDSSTICTASADETLRFWKIFEETKEGFSKKKSFGKMSLEQCTIR